MSIKTIKKNMLRISHWNIGGLNANSNVKVKEPDFVSFIQMFNIDMQFRIKNIYFKALIYDVFSDKRKAGVQILMN